VLTTVFRYEKGGKWRITQKNRLNKSNGYENPYSATTLLLTNRPITRITSLRYRRITRRHKVNIFLKNLTILHHGNDDHLVHQRTFLTEIQFDDNVICVDFIFYVSFTKHTVMELYNDDITTYNQSSTERRCLFIDEKCKLDKTSVSTYKSHTKEQIKCSMPVRLCDSLPNNVIKTTRAIRVCHEAVRNQEETERKTDGTSSSSSVKTMPKI